MLREYTLDNTTYYDSEGLKALINAVFEQQAALVARYAEKEQKTEENWLPVTDSFDVLIRYYTPGKKDKDTPQHGLVAVDDDDDGGHVDFPTVRVVHSYVETIPGAHNSPKKLRLRIGIVRKASLFATDLERLANLVSLDLYLPSDTLRDIACGILNTLQPRWVLAEALRDWHGKKGRIYGFPVQASSAFVEKRILPKCPSGVAVRQRAKKGSGIQEKISVCEERISRLARSHGYAVRARTQLQVDLADAFVKEETNAMALDVERARLERLQEIAYPPTPTPEKED